MNKIKSIIVIMLLSVSALFAQIPDAVNFQAIARKASGEVMSNTNIMIRLTVLDGSVTGTEIYQELRALTTNEYGSFAFQIGRKAEYVTIGEFNDIAWETGNKFLKIDYDPTNQFNWDLTLGTIEFVAVPFAFSSGSVAYIDLTSVQDGDILIYNSTTEKFEPGQIAILSIDWSNIQNVPNFANVATSGDYNELLNLPALFNGSFTNLINKPTTISGYGITDAFSGDYNDLANQPTLFSGNYNNLSNLPTIPNVISDLSNVNTSGVSNGQVLSFDGMNWIPSTISGNSSPWIQNGDNIYYTNGFVGIGNNNPTASLHLASNSIVKWPTASNSDKKGLEFGNCYIYENHPDNSSFGNNTTVTDKLIIGSNSNVYKPIGFFINNQEKVTITTNGNLGVGTNQPEYKLDVSGDINFTGDLYKNGTLFSGSSHWLQNGDNIYYNDGNVGIGTTTPDNLLTIESSTIDQLLKIKGIGIGAEVILSRASNNFESTIYFKTENTTNWMIGMDQLPSEISNDFVIKTTNNAIPEFLIKKNGNVGLGTNNPQFILDIRGENSLISLQPENYGHPTIFGRYATGNYPNDILLYMNSTDPETNGYFRILHNNGGPTSGRVMGLTVEGKVGIGTIEPTSQLQVVGLPEYADNASALAGGLTNGAFYRTGDLLKVVH